MEQGLRKCRRLQRLPSYTVGADFTDSPLPGWQRDSYTEGRGMPSCCLFIGLVEVCGLEDIPGLRAWHCHLLAVRLGLDKSLSHAASVSSSVKW
jgi:hypothetical protein